MNIKILGSGCANCKKLTDNAKKAVEQLGITDADIEKVEDFRDIMAYGVMKTPALVVDEKVIISGRVPSADEIAKKLS